MKKLLWSVGSMKKIARKEMEEKEMKELEMMFSDDVREAEIESRRMAEEEVEEDLAEAKRLGISYEKYMDNKQAGVYEMLAKLDAEANNAKIMDNIIEQNKINLSEVREMKTIAVASVFQCEHCHKISTHGWLYTSYSYDDVLMYTCPHCGKKTIVEHHSGLAHFFPTFISVKKYESGKTVVNCFGEQWIVYLNEKTRKLFLAKNKGYGQVIYAASGQTYVRPFRDFKSGRTLHTISGTATKVEAKRFENVTFSPNDSILYHHLVPDYNFGYVDGKYIAKRIGYHISKDNYYDFFPDFISILEDKHILKRNSKLANRFRNLHWWQIDDLVELRNTTFATITNWDTDERMWYLIKKKVGQIPVDIMPVELVDFVIKYFGRFIDDEIKSMINERPFHCLAIMYMFKKAKQHDFNILKELLNDFYEENSIFNTFTDPAWPKYYATKVARKLYEETVDTFDEEVPW